MINRTFITELRTLLGDDARVIAEPQIVEQLSKDFYWYSPVLRKQLDGKLGDLAPTILTLMGIPIPTEMTGKVLIEK